MPGRAAARPRRTAGGPPAGLLPESGPDPARPLGPPPDPAAEQPVFDRSDRNRPSVFVIKEKACLA